MRAVNVCDLRSLIIHKALVVAVAVSVVVAVCVLRLLLLGAHTRQMWFMPYSDRYLVRPNLWSHHFSFKWQCNARRPEEEIEIEVNNKRDHR